MNRDSWIIICWSYVLGLLTTGIFYFDYVDLSGWNQIIFLLLLILASIIFWFSLAHLKYFKFKTSVAILSIGVFIFAPIYFQLRSPKPQADDISYELANLKTGELVVVEGKVLNEPRITANGKLRFWLKVNQFYPLESTNITDDIKQVSGKLYVTLPLLEAKHIYPQQSLQVKGFLYQPKTPKNPGQFNFKKYLEKNNCFAGFTGINIIEDTTNKKPIWGWWKVRKRIIRAQVKGLGSPIGQLVSSMVLGRRAVDLPYNIRDLFIKTGLAHILAASGFHVSLLLGIVLRLTSSLEAKSKLYIGLGCLFLYSCLTGFSPSVIRAILMGSGVLLALSIGGKVKPLGSLFLSLIIILLVNPLWIWNLGLQLSFLATLGLIVSVPPLEKKFDWMPPLLATSIAVPLAASIWTLPLIIFTFNTISIYSILVNIISMPLVTVISLGGMISSCISLIAPVIGSLCGSLLYYPCLFLIQITKFFADLPGSVVAIGKISLFTLFIIYSLICLVWLNKKYRHKWWLFLLIIIAIIVIPNLYSNFNMFKITILEANKKPIFVIQDKGKVILINVGKNQNVVKYNIIPFLFSQGINKIDYGIALNSKYNSETNWSYLQDKIAVQDLVNDNKLIKTESTEIIGISPSRPENKLAVKNPLVNIKTNKYNWLITNELTPNSLSYIKDYLKQNNLETIPLILVWTGNKLEFNWVNSLKTEIAIALQENSATIESQRDWNYIIERDGSIIWTAKTGFQSLIPKLE